jgi:hypothetical protein
MLDKSLQQAMKMGARDMRVARRLVDNESGTLKTRYETSTFLIRTSSSIDRGCDSPFQLYRHGNSSGCCRVNSVDKASEAALQGPDARKCAIRK